VSAVHCAVVDSGVRVWVIGRYDFARRALCDPRLSKSAAGLTAVLRRKLVEAEHPAELAEMFRRTCVSDDDDHRRLRGLVVAKFTGSRIRDLRPRIEQITDELLDAMPLDDSVDLIQDLALPLPLRVMCELLGVPEQDRELLRGWTSAVMEQLPVHVVHTSCALKEYMISLIRAKRECPARIFSPVWRRPARMTTVCHPASWWILPSCY
jgi:cytochrome P450